MKARSLVTIFFATLLILLVMAAAIFVSLSGAVSAEKYARQEAWQQSYYATQSMKIIDLSGDGQDDLFIQNEDSLRIFNADGSTWFERDLNPPLVTTMGDVDQDGAEDVIALAPGFDGPAATLFARGEEIWSVVIDSFGAPARTAVVRFAQGVQVILGDTDGQLVALDANGAELWRSNALLGSEVRGLDDALVEGGTMLAAANIDGSVALFDAQGQQVWTFNLAGGLRRLRAYDLNSDGQGEVLLGGETGRFIILNASNGDTLADNSMGQTITEIREIEFDGDPSSREVVVGGKGGGVYFCNSQGVQVWSASVSDRVYEIAGLDVDGDGAEEVLIGDGAGGVELFAVGTHSRNKLLSLSSSIARIDVGRLTAGRQVAVADQSSVHVFNVEQSRLPGFNFSPLLVGLVISLVIAVAAWFIATNPPKPALKVAIEDQSPESLQAQRRMLKESIADVERLRQTGEMTSDAYLARLKDLRGQLANNEAAMKQSGVAFTPETFQCPHCGGTLELGVDRCEYCGQVVIT